MTLIMFASRSKTSQRRCLQDVLWRLSLPAALLLRSQQGLLLLLLERLHMCAILDPAALPAAVACATAALIVATLVGVRRQIRLRQ